MLKYAHRTSLTQLHSRKENDSSIVHEHNIIFSISLLDCTHLWEEELAVSERRGDAFTVLVGGG